jgi:hypothetical protein
MGPFSSFRFTLQIVAGFAQGRGGPFQPMKQEFQNGDVVEFWYALGWFPGKVVQVLRMSTAAGERSYRYVVEFADLAEFPIFAEDELRVEVAQSEVRLPGAKKHTTRVFRAPKRKKLRPLRAHDVQQHLFLRGKT